MFGGSCIRSIPGKERGERVLYLTFDDGPDSNGTEAVLDLLYEKGVPATFFAVASKALRRPSLLRRAIAAGHHIGNHSLDHTWLPFFSGKRALTEWISEAERILSDLLGESTVGFRSPAGVRTPQLHAALRELKMPLIHWNVRFYDAVWRWRQDKAIASIEKTQPGSIVLLHDRQKPALLSDFLDTLAAYIDAAERAGFRFAPIPIQDSSI